MKNLFFVLALVMAFGAAEAQAAYYLELGGVEGESSSATGALQVEATVVATSTPARASTNTSSSLEVSTQSGEEKKGNVEMQWKVEEGTKATTQGVEPDEIDVSVSQENATNFGVLLGGGSDDDTEEEKAERMKGLERAQEVILENARASDQAIESISLNFEKITTRVRQEVRLFGFIPIETTATVDIDVSEKVTVTFPWWAIFASGDDQDAVRDRVLTTLSNVLKTKHDTIKNAIGNIR